VAVFLTKIFVNLIVNYRQFRLTSIDDNCHLAVAFFLTKIFVNLIVNYRQFQLTLIDDNCHLAVAVFLNKNLNELLRILIL